MGSSVIDTILVPGIRYRGSGQSTLVIRGGSTQYRAGGHNVSPQLYIFMYKNVSGLF